MQPENRDLAYLFDMLEACRECAEILAASTPEEFIGNRMQIRAIERILEILGEAARLVSEPTRLQHSEIPWNILVGQRNIIAHEYGKIDYTILYNTARNDVPSLQLKLESAIK